MATLLAGVARIVPRVLIGLLDPDDHFSWGLRHFGQCLRCKSQRCIIDYAQLGMSLDLQLASTDLGPADGVNLKETNIVMACKIQNMT